MLLQEAWSTAIMINDKYGYRLLCSGAILNELYIITAAHCEKEARAKLGNDFQNLTVIMGVSNPTWTRMKILRRRGIFRNIENFTVHEKYDGISAYFDVGLIKLDSVINFSTNIWPICLCSFSTAL